MMCLHMYVHVFRCVLIVLGPHVWQMSSKNSLREMKEFQNSQNEAGVVAEKKFANSWPSMVRMCMRARVCAFLRIPSAALAPLRSCQMKGARAAR